jgi:hypothetical protein
MAVFQVDVPRLAITWDVHATTAAAITAGEHFERDVCHGNAGLQLNNLRFEVRLEFFGSSAGVAARAA